MVPGSIHPIFHVLDGLLQRWPHGVEEGLVDGVVVKFLAPFLLKVTIVVPDVVFWFATKNPLWGFLTSGALGPALVCCGSLCYKRWHGR